MRRPTILVLIAMFLNAASTSSEKPTKLSKKEGLLGHGAVFAALDWTDHEISLVSHLHATASYPELMQMMRKKLIVADISLNDRRKIERMLKSLRPPPVFDKFLSDHQIQEVHRAHSENDVKTVLSIIWDRLRQLPEHSYNQAVSYIQRNTPSI